MRSDQAVVVRLSDYSETSQVVTLLTARAGLLRLIGKGTRRSTRTRFAPGLDLLEYGEVNYIGSRSGGLATLTDWKQRELFLDLRRTTLGLAAGWHAAELVEALTEPEDPHPDLFTALLTFLKESSQLAPMADQPTGPAAQAPYLAALVAFQIALLRSIGYLPTMRTCVGCENVRRAGGTGFFSASGGGYVCRNCADSYPDKRGLSAELLRGGLAGGPQAEWFELMNHHLQAVAGREFRTAATLRQAYLGRRY